MPAEMSVMVDGPVHLLTSTKEAKTRTLEKLINKMAESLTTAIRLELEKSIQLMSYVGETVDPEVTRAILRSINARVELAPKLSINIEYGDVYGHLYNEAITDNIKDIVKELVEKVVNVWFNSPEMDIIFTKAITEKAM